MRGLERLSGGSWGSISAAPVRHRRIDWFVGIALVAAVTVVIDVLKPHAPASGLGVLYLLAVLPAAIFWGTAVALGISLLSAAALAFQLDVSRPADGVALSAFVLTALVVAQLAARSRREARVAERLAEEQAALRRVATLVARGVPPEDLFAAVTEEVGQLLPVGSAAMGRHEPDGSFATVAAWSTGAPAFPLGSRWEPGGKNVMTIVFETGRPARMDTFADASGPVGVAAREAGYRSGVGTPIMVDGLLWGVMTAASSAEQPLPPDTEARLASFTELVATAIANAESRAGLGRLAEEQAALRRVATLVARGVPPEEVFAAVAAEVGKLLGTGLAGMTRYGSDDTTTVVATWAAEGEHGGAHPLVPGPWPLEGDDLASMIARTGRSVRIDDYRSVTGRIAAFVRDELGVGSSIGSPITVEGRLWGALFAHAKQTHQLPPDAESRLTGFTGLVGTAIANAESRSAVRVLADEQAALRRVATLVARGLPPTEIFAAVAEEIGRLAAFDGTRILRYEADGTATVIAGWSKTVEVPRELEVGARLSLDGESVSTLVFRTGRPARIDDYAKADGPLSEPLQTVGVRSAAGAPIIVEGRLWGAMTAGSTTPEPMPSGLEFRLAEFTELVATAIANAESRSELAASRARIVAASDETRRRVERDLHDGAQQRLVTLALALRSAQAELPHDLEEVRAELSHVGQGLTAVLDELREISRGIHPAILSEGGLAPALKSLARRSPIPVALDVRVDGRLPDGIEVAAYYVVSEMLTNTAKHAQASAVYVDVAQAEGVLHISIRDDGIGGADPTRGSGLVGLRDRVDALGGTIAFQSAKGAGTAAEVTLPLAGTGEASEQVAATASP